MKNIILSFLLSLIFLKPVSGQDTTSPKFFPMSTGNTWVYTLTNTEWGVPVFTQTVIMKITDSVIVNGHVYFTFSVSSIQGGACSFLPYMSGAPLRVDSITGNIMLKVNGSGCQNTPGEAILDSLFAQPSNGFFSGCNERYYCNISSSTTKMFSSQSTWPPKGRQYTYGIGLTSSYIHQPPMYQCWYELKGWVLNGIVFGDTTLTAISNSGNEIPVKFSLYQNFPNPFNPSTNISFDLPEPSFITLSVYGVKGQKITVLVNEKLNSGRFTYNWDGGRSPSGIYFYKLESGGFTQVRKMLLIK